MRLTGPIGPAQALAIYLEDHHAGAQAGAALARRAARNQRGTPAGTALQRLREDVEHDEQVLRRVMDRAGASPSPVKAASARILERLARLKPNGQLFGSSPLSAVVELEGLLSAVKSKRHVWMALAAAGVDPGDVDPAEMIARADDQVERLERSWEQATRDAFPSPAAEA